MREAPPASNLARYYIIAIVHAAFDASNIPSPSANKDHTINSIGNGVIIYSLHAPEYISTGEYGGLLIMINLSNKLQFNCMSVYINLFNNT